MTSEQINRLWWDERAPAHAASAEYESELFASDPGHLSDVVRFDRPLLGDVRGLRGVHLQCHIGTDTISLARLGACMTGLDFSPAAIEQAVDLAARADVDVRYVVSDVDSAVDVLGGGAFDLVYTGIGALCWLPRIADWARVVAGLLVPGGRLFVREGHPILWALDYDRTDDLLALRYSYGETVDPLVEFEDGSYVETATGFVHTENHSWNHGLGEIVSALINVGMEVTGLVEHDSVPWRPLREDLMICGPDAQWRLRADLPAIPLTYTLSARKR